MSGVGLSPEFKPMSKKQAVGQGALFVVPSLVITIISIVFFLQLRYFTAEWLNMFSVTIIAAVVLSLLGTAVIQIVIYRVQDDSYYRDGAALRGIRLGIFYSIIASLALSAAMAPYFLSGLGFPVTYYLHFVLLMLLYSGTWIITSTFWAVGQYKYPALIFTIAYLVLLASSYGAYQVGQDYAISGYTGGIAILLLLSWLAARMEFARPREEVRLVDDLSGVGRLISQNIPAIIFNFFYVLAIFLDKIIVWAAEGVKSGSGLLVTGEYAIGSFLGLVPLFSIVAAVYFSSRSRALTGDFYKGTLREIQDRIREYKRLYQAGQRMMLVMWTVLFIAMIFVGSYFFASFQIMNVLITMGLGSLLFTAIIYNSSVLPIFGKTIISAVAVVAVCVFEFLSIFFVAYDSWYASAGFLLGSLVGFLISHISTQRLLHDFDYNVFHYLSSTA